MSDWNDTIIADFRAHAGHVGHGFEGMPMLLLHHTGRRTGRALVNPLTYQAGPGDTVYVFASKGGAPDTPQWYLNALASGQARVEIGTQAFDVTARDVTGAERDAVWTRQKAAYPGFAEYEQKTEGIRTIPVLALTRA